MTYWERVYQLFADEYAYLLLGAIAGCIAQLLILSRRGSRPAPRCDVASFDEDQ